MHRHHRWALYCVLLAGAACLSPEERQAALFAQANAAEQAGDLPRAIASLKAAVGYDPSDLEAVTRLAEMLVRADLAQQARVLLDQFPAEAKRNSRFMNLNARLLIRFGRVKQALPILLALEARGGADPATVVAAAEAWVAARTKPSELSNLPSAWRLTLADHLLESKNVDLAADWLQTLPGNSVEMAQVTDRLLEEALKSDGAELSEAVLGLAERGDTANKALVLRRHLATKKDWPELRRVEEQFLADYAGHAGWTEVALATAWRSLRAGDPRTAERLAGRIAALDPRSVEPLVVRGLALRELGRESEARRALQLALALDPTNTTARRALLSQEREPDAIQIDLHLQGATAENR
ncbi:MAG: tetratricopeptide repeat protein [Thermoanaerobaculia bacterium]